MIRKTRLAAAVLVAAAAGIALAVPAQAQAAEPHAAADTVSAEAIDTANAKQRYQETE